MTGAVKYVEETRAALCRKGEYERQIRDATTLDEKDEECFNLAV